jgi:hypothetical protein
MAGLSPAALGTDGLWQRSVFCSPVSFKERKLDIEPGVGYGGSCLVSVVGAGHYIRSGFGSVFVAGSDSIDGDLGRGTGS